MMFLQLLSIIIVGIGTVKKVFCREDNYNITGSPLMALALETLMDNQCTIIGYNLDKETAQVMMGHFAGP